jgi:hypothetical protein
MNKIHTSSWNSQSCLNAWKLWSNGSLWTLKWPKQLARIKMSINASTRARNCTLCGTSLIQSTMSCNVSLRLIFPSTVRSPRIVFSLQILRFKICRSYVFLVSPRVRTCPGHRTVEQSEKKMLNWAYPKLFIQRGETDYWAHNHRKSLLSG